MDRSVLARKQLVELKDIAAHLEMRGYQRLRKADLIEAIVRATNGQQAPAVAGRGDAAQLDLGAAGSGTGSGGAGVNGGGTATRTRRRDRAEEPGAERDDAPSGAGGDTPPRPRVRTRTRELTEQARDDGADDERGDADDGGARDRDAADDGRSAGRRRDGRDQDRGDQGRGDQGRGDQDRGAPTEEARDRRQSDAGRDERHQRDDRDGRQADDQSDDDEDARGKRRRSRRERRRNKGGDGQGQGQGGGQGGQGAHGQHGQQGGHGQQGQQSRSRDDDGGSDPGEVREGVLDVLPEGYGFLRTTGYLPGDRDVYVSQGQIRKHGLRRGDVVSGPIRQQRSSEKVPALHHVDAVNGARPDDSGQLPHRPDFKDMTPLFPDERLRLETPDGPISMRIMDLMSPIGKGQRGLIVSPPKAGKTTILKELGQAIARNNPECHLMVVLVDERPEEVTDMRRSIPGEVIASTFDRPADDHTQIAELAMERAKRLVERGEDVVVLLDSITRLARAYNLSAPASGRIMSGGVDSTALYPPKRFFGAARNIEHGGSLTIIASALIETGSKMDEVIFEEFKGTGNMEIRLDRRLEQKRIFPAIDIEASGTRKEELLLDREELTIIWKLRRVLHALEGPAALELLIDKMKATRSNNQFLVQIQKSNLQT